MRAYVVTTGIVFGLLAVAHVVRIIAERPALATDLWYMLTTVAAAALAVWAWRVLRVLPRS